MAKYHISDNGMPGKCTASSPDSCPKTQAGDSFHGTLEEATAEAHSRFEKELGAFATASKADEAKVAAGEAFADRFSAAAKAVIADPSAENESKLRELRMELSDEIRSGRGAAIVDSKTYEAAEEALGRFRNGEGDGEVYFHPQGKIIKVDEDGTVHAYKNGKEVSTSATAEKLREGYGGWKRGAASDIDLPESAPAKIVLTPAQEAALFDNQETKREEYLDAQRALAQVHKDHRAYDQAHGVAEGRAYHYGPNGRTDGPSPDGRHTSFVQTDAQKAEKRAVADRAKAARRAEEDAQTSIEEAGLGHRIPDDGNTVRVRTQAQKWLLKNELQGQISDGKWENTANNPWQDWSGAKVIVDPRNPGRNFNTTKDNYQLNAQDLLDVVGDRMIEDVQDRTGNGDYDEKAMRADLADLRKIFKTKRDRIEG